MRSSLLIVLFLGALALVIAMLVLGEFPPQPHPKQIEKVLPNERFQPH